MITAFQPAAFQNDAFQIAADRVVEALQGGGGKRRVAKRIKKRRVIVLEVQKPDSGAVAPFPAVLSAPKQVESVRVADLRSTPVGRLLIPVALSQPVVAPVVVALPAKPAAPAVSIGPEIDDEDDDEEAILWLMAA